MIRQIDLHVDRITVLSAERIDGEALAEALHHALHAAFSSGVAVDPTAAGYRDRIRVRAAPGPRAIADAVAGALRDSLGGATTGRSGDVDGLRSGAPGTPHGGGDPHE